MLINCFLSLGIGMSNYLVPGSDIDLLMSTLQHEKINFMFCVPPILQRLIVHPKWASANIQSLQHIVVGAARCTTEVQQAVTNRMAPGASCQQGWGMTELTFLATMPIPGVLGPWESVGKALEGNRIKICDEQGQEVEVGREGEIYVSGDYALLLY
jgi:acyl-coenzyme A synthetase/AMP-(fatty) acid ligase